MYYWPYDAAHNCPVVPTIELMVSRALNTLKFGSTAGTLKCSNQVPVGDASKQNLYHIAAKLLLICFCIVHKTMKTKLTKLTTYAACYMAPLHSRLDSNKELQGGDKNVVGARG